MTPSEQESALRSANSEQGSALRSANEPEALDADPVVREFLNSPETLEADPVVRELIKRPGGIILAAGASSRMGQPKALLEFHGETFLARMVRIFAPHCDPLVVVVAPGCETWVPAGSARPVVNPQPERGMLSSLQCGLAEFGNEITGHILFTPMDLPALREETVAAVAVACGRAAVVIPRLGETRGHPVSIDGTVAAELLALSGGPEAQPKHVLRRDDSRVLFLEIDDPGSIRDVDEPQDYQELLLSSLPLSNVETLS